MKKLIQKNKHTMNPKPIFAILLLTMAVCVWAQYNPENDFTVVRSNDGRSITITGYTGTRQAVNIPPTIQGLPVTEIGTDAFSEKQLTSVIIPNGVTIIGEGAFWENQLTSIIIPNSVTVIGDWAFSANKITSVTIPNSITKIGEGVFDTNQLTSVNIPNSVTSIGAMAFYGNQLTSVTIPNSVTSIGNSVFNGNQLTSITIPNSVTSIGSSAFRENQLTSVTIPNSVTSIGSSAFRGNQLTSVTIPNSITTIGNFAFAENRLTSVSIPNSVTSIGSSAFVENQLNIVTIGNSVTSIGTLAFAGNKLTSVTIPNSVTTIGDRAFTVNELTGTITIPNSVTSIGGWSFCCNPNLRAINVSSANPNYSSIDGVLYSKNGSALILWPGGKSGAVTIPGGVTSIGKGAFCGNNFTSIYIPNNVTAIEDGAFAGNQFTRVTLPANVNIADNAFEGEIAKLYKDNGRTAFHYENGFIARITPLQNNPKQADLMIGSAVFQEIQVSRFLNDAAAVSRNEAVLNFITGRGDATRAEIEAFYRNNIRAQIEGVVDRELTTGKSVNNDTRRVINEIVTTPLINFYLSPIQANFDILKRNHTVLGQIINMTNYNIRTSSNIGNLRQYGRQGELLYDMIINGVVGRTVEEMQRQANAQSGNIAQTLRQVITEMRSFQSRTATQEFGISNTTNVEWEKISLYSVINALNNDLARMLRQ